MEAFGGVPTAQPEGVRGFLTRRRGHGRLHVTDIATYAYLIIGTVVMFGPVLWLVMSSFKPRSLLFEPNPTFLPYQQVTVKVDGYDEPLNLYDLTFRDATIDGAKITLSNIQATNGVVQGIDTVLLTPAQQEALNKLGAGSGTVPEGIASVSIEDGNLLDVIRAQPELSIGAELLESVNLSEVVTVEGDTKYTFLMPTNEAFAAFFAEYGTAVLEDQELLRTILLHHILPDRYLVVNFYRSINTSIPTLLPDDMLPIALETGETRRLAQIGSPKGAEYTMIDPDNPEAGTISVFAYGTVAGLSVIFEPVREVKFSLDNFRGGVKAFPFWRYLRNSIIVTTAATIVTLIINSMAAFALSKYRFAGRDIVFIIIISTLMVPISVILIPAFLVISEVGWVNSFWGVIIPGAATPTGVFLLRQYMLTIPDELLDSARIDGATEWRIYWQIILPLARPALAVLAIFSVMWRWNDFLWPLIVLNQNELFTLQVGLNAFQGALDIQWHYILAMTVLTLLPITLVFAFLQRYITSGIATTGMKG
jgi:alpha-1,4-digalacturonate transport system permease protein